MQWWWCFCHCRNRNTYLFPIKSRAKIKDVNSGTFRKNSPWLLLLRLSLNILLFPWAWIRAIFQMTARGETCNLALSLMEIVCDLWFWQLETKVKLRYYSFWEQRFFLVSFLGELICIWQIALKVMEMNRNNFTQKDLCWVHIPFNVLFYWAWNF